MNTQIVNVPERSTGHKAHAQQERPSDGLALYSQRQTAPSFRLLRSSPGSFSLPCFLFTRSGKMITCNELPGKAFYRPRPLS